jgi:hypothetical protein
MYPMNSSTQSWIFEGNVRKTLLLWHITSIHHQICIPPKILCFVLAIVHKRGDHLLRFGHDAVERGNSVGAPMPGRFEQWFFIHSPCSPQLLILILIADSAEMKWTSKSHWTSGSDRACPFNFKWCTSNTFFYNNSINWLSGQPNNAFNQQECVQMMLNTGSGVATTYDDQPCSFLSYYICEVHILQKIIA